MANRKLPDSYRLHFIAPTRTLQAAIGLQLSSLEPLPTKLTEDSIVVLTGVSGESVDLNEPSTQRVVAWLESGVTSPGLLLCVCAGSVIAGKAGLLAGRECTSHHSHIEELRRVAPTAHVLDNRIFVEDGPVLSSAGVTAGLDLTLH